MTINFNEVDLEIVDSIEVSFGQTLNRLIDKVSSSKPEVLLALSGGPTATKCYDYFCRSYNKSLDFSLIDVIVGDERCVPVDDPDSNFGMIRSTFRKYNINPKTLTPLDCSNNGFLTEKIIRQHSTIDIIHLGLGADGHTASLFPDSSALNVQQNVLITKNEDIHKVNLHERITLTFEAINSATYRVVTVSGAEKAEIMKKLFDGDDLPARMLNPNNLIFLVDIDAASHLGR